MRSKTRRSVLALTAVSAAAAMLVPLDSQAITAKIGAPGAATGSVRDVRGNSAMLEGTVEPHGLLTAYYFQYGPTVAYGSQTAPATLPASFTHSKVGATVTGLRLGEHYRIVATNADGTLFGHDRVYAAKTPGLRIVVAKERNTPPIPYGQTYVLRGTVSGGGNAAHQVVLQASRYPYLEAFGALGAPVFASATGSFVLKAPHLTSSTQFRVATLDPRPLLSPVITARVSVRVTLKVRSSSRPGFVRLYGTVLPAEVGARVEFQLLKAIRPGRSERETAFGTQFSTKSKRATHSMSRFSIVASIHKRGYYRAYVKLRKGPLVSGASKVVRLNAVSGPSRGKRS